MPNFSMYTPFMLPSLTSSSALTTTAAEASAPQWSQPARAFKLSKSQTNALKENALKTMRPDEGGVFAAAKTAGGCAVPSIAMGLRPNTSVVNSEFLKLEGGNLKYANLFEKNPTFTSETMQSLNKLQKKFARDIKRYQKAGLDASSLSTDLATLNGKLSTALESGNLSEIAKVKAEIDAANSVNNGLFKSFIRKLKGGEQFISRSNAGAEAIRNAGSNIPIPQETKIISKAGLYGGGLMFAGAMLGEIGTIKEAYQYDKKAGRKQLFQSTGKAGLTSAAYIAGESVGRQVITKYVVPKMAKFAAKKLAIAGAGKAIGGAIGSCIPVIGTVVGVVVGCLFEWAFKKWISPALFGKDSALAKVKSENMSQEDLLNTAIQNYSMGQQLDTNSLNAVKNYYKSTNNMAEFYELRKLNNEVSHMSKKELKQYQKDIAAQQAQQEMQAQNTAA